MLDNNVALELIVLPDGSINMEADPSTLALVDYEKQNSKAIKVLNEGGFNGNVFRKYAPRKKAPPKVSLPNTRARQDALSSVRYSSEHFILLNGDTLNSNNNSISEERQSRQAHIKDLEATKKQSITVLELN